MGILRDYLTRHFRHFNAAALVDAAVAWEAHLNAGGKMLLTMGGAMSTAEIGLVLAELIRQNKVHALSVTGANLEEDVFNLVAHDSYERIPRYRDLTPADELRLLERGMNRVTDTCIPEEKAVRRIERHFFALVERAESLGERHFPHEYFYQLLRSGTLAETYEIDPKDSWMVAAAERDLPIFVPGWEDSTLGNAYVARSLTGRLKGLGAIKNGYEQMAALVGWYRRTAPQSPIGFLQIGGGISGDFPICAVPLLNQDMRESVPLWAYFCQISEAKASYGSYSGADPSEKITWGKLGRETPSFIVESDATIVFPLMAGYVLDR